MLFEYNPRTRELKQGEQKLSPHYDERGNPYFVFPDEPQHWIKFHLNQNGNLYKVFYKSPTVYYLKKFSPPRRSRIINLKFTEKDEAINNFGTWKLKKIPHQGGKKPL